MSPAQVAALAVDDCLDRGQGGGPGHPSSPARSGGLVTRWQAIGSTTPACARPERKGALAVRAPGPPGHRAISIRGEACSAHRLPRGGVPAHPLVVRWPGSLLRGRRWARALCHETIRAQAGRPAPPCTPSVLPPRPTPPALSPVARRLD